MNNQNRKQTSIEKTLLIGLGLGLLIGFLSKRIAYGLLLGIGLTFLISYVMKPKADDQQ
jgi:L-cystine uptake protein TcyP (sodium:dicarboxylate symporter family)